LFLDEVGSTNEFALELCHAERPAEGTVVVTKYQSDGRGQRGKKWVSERGVSAMFSVIYSPSDIPPTNQFVLVQMASIAVYKAIQELDSHLEVTIKWPNDIYIEDMKVGGILIQNILKGGTIDYTVIGMGVNLNQDIFPEELPNPTSLLLETGLEYDRMEFIKLVVKYLDQMLIKRDVENLNEDYHRALYLKDEDSIFYLNDEIIEGRILGTDASGKLKIDVEGVIKKFTFGELVYG
jgi:BirA family biotin operon repressor/biotin-[acetyl-CoA-carboxylase] ligase